MTMENPKTLLEAWRAIEPQQIRTGRIKTSPDYQPRNERIAPFRDRSRLQEQSRSHIEDLQDKLEGGNEMEPVLVADIDGKLWLIDGHHRLQAYKRTRRETIPARIRQSSPREALIASKAANCDGVKLPMHTEQRREAAWQYMAMVTHQGRFRLPKDMSSRALARIFSTSKDTIQRMRKKLEQVKTEDYSSQACDPGTGWPMWKYVKGNAFRDAFADVPEDIRERHRLERLAVKLAKLIDKEGKDSFLNALKMLEDEAVQEAAERLREALSGEPEEDY